MPHSSSSASSSTATFQASVIHDTKLALRGLNFQMSRTQRKLKSLKKEMSAAEHELLGRQRAIKRLGRYSVRNVNKREKRLTTTVCSLQKTCDDLEEDKADSHARIQALQIYTEYIRKKLQDSEKGIQNCNTKLISAHTKKQ